MHGMRVHYSIILVSDMEQYVAFYRDVVGMPLKFESPDWSEFRTDGATWALHSCAPNEGNTGETRKEIPGTCRPGFQVTDLELFHSRMVENNVRCVQVPTETFGTKVAQYVDPDGMVFSVSLADDR